MGKKGGWLTAVKRAFRSPTKDTPKKTKNHDQQPQEEEDQQDQDKRDKRRWIFRKQANQEPETKAKPSTAADQRHAVGVADATVDKARLHVNHAREKEQRAAIVIQTAFRGYLARRALRALKGLVKLQALVRGHSVRKQAKMTLRCMQALVRLQARVLDQRSRFSHEGSSSRKSIVSDTNNNNNSNNSNSLWESRYLQDNSDRKSMGSSIASDWDELPHTVEQVKAMLQRRKEAALKRDKSFSQQSWRNGGASSSSIGNEEERSKRLDRWMTMGRASTDQRERESVVKNVEMDITTSQPYSSSYLPTSYRRSHPNYQYNPVSHQLHQHQRHSIASPATPSPAKSRPIQVRSASPRIGREDRSSSSSSYQYQYQHQHQHSSHTPSLRRGGNHGGANLPNYMAATESAKARSRSQSAPRQRASTPERDRAVGSAARKRLSYPDAHSKIGYGHGLRSPSFRSVRELQYFGLEQHSNYSSCCTDSLGGEISPASTTDLRRWLT